jgi:hypothetical protein
LQWLASAEFEVSTSGAGSFFKGGLAEFSIAAGKERALANHVSGGGEMFASAVFASVRATDWRPLREETLRGFAATVRIARECIVLAAASTIPRNALENESAGVLSLSRRKALLDAIDRRDWQVVWQSVSLSELFYLGAALVQNGPGELWNSTQLATMREDALHAGEMHVFGQVAPELNGVAAPRLAPYLPYEEYQCNFPSRLAQRAAELKLYLAWLADRAAWTPQELVDLAPEAADAAMKRVVVHDLWDWQAVISAYNSLDADILKESLEQ